jgi:hypothetical protein
MKQRAAKLTPEQLLFLRGLTDEQLAFPGMPARNETRVPEWMTVVSRIFSSRKSRSVLRVISTIKARYETLPLAISLADGEFWTGIPNEILEAHRQHGLFASEHAVLLVLYQKCWYMRPGKDPEWMPVSLDGFAVATGLDRRTVQRAIKSLEELDIVGVLHRGSGRGVRNLYIVKPASEWKSKPKLNRDTHDPISSLERFRDLRVNEQQ